MTKNMLFFTGSVEKALKCGEQCYCGSPVFYHCLLFCDSEANQLET